VAAVVALSASGEREREGESDGKRERRSAGDAVAPSEEIERDGERCVFFFGAEAVCLYSFP
jgi:hypothetical protein